MKRIILTTITALATTLSATAQVGEFRNDLAIGGNAGINLNRISFDPHVSQQFHIGPEIGAGIRYTCERYFKLVCAIQTEINFSQKGWKETMNDNQHTYSRTSNYINIPFLARLGYGHERKGFMGYLLAGPQLGFFLSESQSYTGDWSDEYKASIQDHRTAQHDISITKKFEYGITAGAGIEYSHPKAGHFSLDARYFFGLSDIFGNSKKDVFGRSANTSITIKLSYYFDLIKTKAQYK